MNEHPASLPPRSGPSLLLGEQLCFALYSTHLAMQKVYRKLLDELDVTYPQYLVLLVLWEQEGLRVAEIGERLFLESSTLTPLLKRMEAMMLLTRQRASTDERQVIIRLTEQGRQLRLRATAVPGGVFCATGCPLEQLTVLRDQLLVLRTNLFNPPGNAESTD